MQNSHSGVTLVPRAAQLTRRASLTAKTNLWGLFPFLCLTSSFGLLMVALANTLSRNADELAPALFWGGLLVVFIPIAARLVSPEINRQERLALVLVLGCSLYLVKVLHSPLDFTFHDEFLHWQTANNLMRDGRLFTENSILPVSPLYPGLEVVTTAFANLSGLSIVESGVITLGIARVIFMLALFLFYERISDSAQVGGIATLLYTANSNFIFFDSQFSYESLSLPIAMTVLYAISGWNENGGRRFFGQFLIVLPLIFLVAITHHLTGYVLAALLGLWTVTSMIRRQSPLGWMRLGLATLTTLTAVIGWTLIVGNETTQYLAPVFRSGINEVLSLLLSDNTGRELFRNAAGQISPLWERLVGIGGVIFILLVLPIGILQIVVSPFRSRLFSSRIVVLPARVLAAWRQYGKNAAALAFAVIVLLHPVMQAFRLTSSGWEIANRSSEFLFWAIAFILAAAVLLVGAFARTRLWLPLFLIWASVIFVSGAISGSPPWSRQPGTYLVSADSRSVEPEGLEAARWASEHLPPQSRTSADRINTLLMSVYGNQRAITHLADDIYLASVFASPTFGEDERRLLDRADTDYLIVDSRLSTSLPLVGVYFEAGEPRVGPYREPMSAQALAKFDSIAGISRIFDSGNIRIYDVRRIHDTT